MAQITETQQLLVKISADASSAVKGFGQLKGSVDSLGSTVMKVAGAIGAAFALRDVINSTQAWANQLDNLHDTLGLSGDEAAKWNYQARLVGTTADDVATAFGQLTNKIGNSLPAIQQGTSDFDKWGIKVLDSNNSLLGASDILDQVREKVNALGPGLGARQIEMDLFGRSGGKLHDFLSLSNEEIERMNKDLKELGLPTNVDELEAMNRESNRLGIIFDSIKVKLGSALLPVLLAAGRGLAQLAGFVKVFGEAMRGPVGILKEMIDRLSTFIADVKAVGFGGAVEKLIQDFVEEAKKVLPKIGEKLDELGPLGWALKVAIGAFAFSWGIGVLASLFGNLARFIIGGATWLSGPIAGLGLPVVASIGLGVLLGLSAYKIFVDWDSGTLYDRILAVISGGLMAAGIVLAAAGILIGGAPIAISVGLGLLLGVVGYQMGTATGLDGMIEDIGGSVATWIHDHVPGVAFFWDPVGQAFKTSLETLVTFLVESGGVDTSGLSFDLFGALGEWLDENVPGHKFFKDVSGGAFRWAVDVLVDWFLKPGNTTGGSSGGGFFGPPPPPPPPQGGVGGPPGGGGGKLLRPLTPEETAQRIVDDAISNLGLADNTPLDQLPVSVRQDYLAALFGTAGGDSGIIQAATGFHGVVGGPTMFLAGERAPERVDIGPVGGSGGNVYLTVNVGSVDDRRRIKELTDAISAELMGRVGSRRAVAF